MHEICIKIKESNAWRYKAGDSMYKNCVCQLCEHIDICIFLYNLKTFSFNKLRTNKCVAS